MNDGLLAVPVPAQSRRDPFGASDGRDDLGCQLMAAADADADAFADRLHDGALQALVVARYATDAAVRGGDPALARDAVQEALVVLRRAVWLLRARGADDLPEALAELSKRRVAGGGAALDLDLDVAVAGALDAAARAAAYRFVQAATADAGGRVQLGRDGAYAVLSVSGPAPAGWTARAAALGGRLEGSAEPTRLLLPLTPPASDPEGDR